MSIQYVVIPIELIKQQTACVYTECVYTAVHKILHTAYVLRRQKLRPYPSKHSLNNTQVFIYNRVTSENRFAERPRVGQLDTQLSVHYASRTRDKPQTYQEAQKPKFRNRTQQLFKEFNSHKRTKRV